MKYDYFFRGRPEVKKELAKLGVQIIDVDVGGGETWPGLRLPSGAVLAIATDDEGNGPGALHVFSKGDCE